MAEFTFRLDGLVAAQLEELARQLNVPPAQALSTALANTAFLVSQTRKGADVLLRKPNRQVEVVNLESGLAGSGLAGPGLAGPGLAGH